MPCTARLHFVHESVLFGTIYIVRRPHIPNRAQQPKKQLVQIDQELVKIFQQGLSAHQHGQFAQAKAAYE